MTAKSVAQVQLTHFGGEIKIIYYAVEALLDFFSL